MFSYSEITAETPATAEFEKSLSDPGPVFHKFLTQGPDPGPNEKRSILPKSTPALRIHGQLCWQPEMSGMSYFAIQVQS